jgi:hypothetical protein
MRHAIEAQHGHIFQIVGDATAQRSPQRLKLCGRL